MQPNEQLEQLVDEITRRVKARMGQADHAEPETSCVDGACESCGGCSVKRPDDVRQLVRLGASRIGAAAGHGSVANDLAGLIDHTLLKPDAGREELKKLCEEAREYNFATVCVNSANIRYCAALLEGSQTVPIAVVGFPLGAGTSSAKAFEAREAVRQGAGEIDMVINVGALKSRDYTTVLNDMAAVVTAAAPKPVKVIIETGLLNRDQKIIACSLAKVAGAAYVKTSTGFGPGGATVEDIHIMRDVVGPEMGVKASGGVRTEDDARKMIEAGATRIGASASVAIVTGAGRESKGKTKLRVVGGY